MPLKFGQTKCNSVKFNSTTLSVIKFNGNNIFKSGNVVFKYTLTSQNSGLNSYANRFYVTLKNMRTGVTKTVGGSMGTTTASLPAVEGDIIKVEAHGNYEGSGTLEPVSPLQDGIYGGYVGEMVYPVNSTDITFTANLQIKGYYDADLGRWVANNYIKGTVTANYYIKIDTDID